jgi:hypothetical protein
VSLSALEQMSGGLWPYLVVVLFGFLPTEVWRIAGVFAAKNLHAESPFLLWVRLVASALVAGVVAKLLISPSGALAIVPIWGRLGALTLGFMAFLAARKSVFAGLLTGEAAIIAAGWWATH